MSLGFRNTNWLTIALEVHGVLSRGDCRIRYTNEAAQNKQAHLCKDFIAIQERTFFLLVET